MPSRPPRIYIVGPLRPTQPNQIITARMENIHAADELAQRLLLAGAYPFCPHTMTQFWHASTAIKQVEDELVVQGWCLAWIDVSDAIMTRGKWRDSAGSQVEVEYAMDKGIVVLQSWDDFEVWMELWRRNENA